MARVVVNDNLIGIPQPITDVAEIELGHAEAKSAEPKTSWTASCKTEDMTSPDAARESSMLKGPIEMKAGIIAARIVADPLVVGVDVGSLGVSRLIRKIAALLSARL